MLIPKQLDILGHIYDIVLHKDMKQAMLLCDLKQEGEFSGCFNSELRKIYIDSGLSSTQRSQILLHEIIEILSSQMVMNLVHDNVERLEHGLYYVLDKNKMLRE